MLTAKFGHRHTVFSLAQDRKDLGFAISRHLHSKFPRAYCRENSTYEPHYFRGDYPLSARRVIALVEESVIANLPSADKYGVQFNVIAQDRDLWGLTNPKIFHQVMTNLLSNAAKFSDGGSKIDVEINKAQDHVRISITNDGDGIPIEFQDHIFKPFSQAAPSATRSREGTGIGLSIVKQIVEQSGGKIGFESHAGKRTTFWFTPPRDQSQGG